MMILFLIAGVIGAIYLFNYFRGRPGLSIDGLGDKLMHNSQNPSLEIIQKRFASGEISRSEYNEMKNTILEDGEI